MATNEMENTVENTTPSTEAPSAPAQVAPKPSPRKRTPAKANGKTPAKKAPAKKTAPKGKATPKAPTGGKVRWTVVQVFANGKNQDGKGFGGTAYQIVRRADGSYAARVTTAKGAKTTLLESDTFSKAYWVCVDHNKANFERHQTAAAKRASKKVDTAA